MIDRNDMMGILLDASPSFTPKWQEFLVEWQWEPGPLPLYLVLADFAQHLIGMMERGDITGLPDIFAAVERLHIEGEHYVREAATIGILECLQNLNLHPNGTEPEQFRPFLGKVSEDMWDELYRWWESFWNSRPE